jgi:hypothetical protein
MTIAVDAVDPEMVAKPRRWDVNIVQYDEYFGDFLLTI